MVSGRQAHRVQGGFEPLGARCRDGRFDKVFSEEGKIPIPACWSPDGKDIYVYLRDAGGPNASNLRRFRDRAGQAATDCREGSRLSVRGRVARRLPAGGGVCEGRNCNLWVMPAAGGKRVQITSGPGYDDGPAWSPDGRRIAFVSTALRQLRDLDVEADIERIRKELATRHP